MMQQVKGFSKLSKEQKLQWLAENFSETPEQLVQELKSYWHEDAATQKVFDEFSENTITNFYLPYGIAPNVMINGKMFAVPMVIEESSVVAAASKSAKFWSDKGGFKAEILSTTKIGQVHFIWNGNPKQLYSLYPELKEKMILEAAEITKNMEKRGGGILDIELIDQTHLKDGYYQLMGKFETCDSMGANFINSCLESFADSLTNWVGTSEYFTGKDKDVTVVMSIVSNFTPECIVRCKVECPIDDLGIIDGLEPNDFAQKFKTAIEIANLDPHRATTHNKGIFNGIDAVILATGNDFRAVEACGHTYAARNGSYQSLTNVNIENDTFCFWIDLPLAIGTVGGLTALHPLVKRSLEILNHPNAEELMKITATIGLAQNFGAIKSLITTGIQKGHMKMHLLNILNHFKASEKEIQEAIEHFKNNIVSFSSVDKFLSLVREKVSNKK